MGCPIRISTDQRLLAAPRGFSQRATSFIASWCQGIHRMPFLYSISRSSLAAREHLTMHRNHPQTRIEVRTTGMMFGNMCFPRPLDSHPDKPGGDDPWGHAQHDRLRWPFPRNRLRSPLKDPPDTLVHNASEPSPPAVGRPFSGRMFPFEPANSRSRSDNSAEQRDLHQPRSCNHGSMSITRAQRRTRT